MLRYCCRIAAAATPPRMLLFLRCLRAAGLSLIAIYYVIIFTLDVMFASVFAICCYADISILRAPYAADAAATCQIAAAASLSLLRCLLMMISLFRCRHYLPITLPLLFHAAPCLLRCRLFRTRCRHYG